MISVYLQHRRSMTLWFLISSFGVTVPPRLCVDIEQLDRCLVRISLGRRLRDQSWIVRFRHGSESRTGPRIRIDARMDTLTPIFLLDFEVMQTLVELEAAALFPVVIGEFLFLTLHLLTGGS